MHRCIIGTLTFLLRFAAARTSAQLCRGTSQLSDDGNWYCSEVRAITYRNISQPGVYNRTTRVDPNTGLCDHEPVSYPGTGPLTPLFGELSMHLRGPMNVSKLAVYMLPGDFYSPQKRATIPSDVLDAGHIPDAVDGPVAHVALAEPAKEVDLPVIRFLNNSTVQKRTGPGSCSSMRTVTATVFVTAMTCPTTNPFDFATSTRIQPSGGLEPPLSISCSCTLEPQASGVASVQTSTTHTCSGTESSSPAGTQQPAQHATVTAVASPLAQKREVVIAAAPPWSRIASYTSAAPAAATGFAFLANLGDERKSGTFDYSFGNSLGYVIGNGKTVASQNTPFDGTLETSEVEIAVFTDQQCRTGDCEARPRATAHYGFGGESKVFLIEFQMDHYDNVGTDQGMLSDAPAWWFLNAAIPRVLQYGNDKRNIPCSCWSSGCGEFDAFEVLGRGEERAKSTIHRQGNLEGGDSNFFRRPVGRMLKFAVIFHNFNITASVLPDTFDFSQTLTAGQIDNIIAYDPDSYTHSLFPIGD